MKGSAAKQPVSTIQGAGIRRFLALYCGNREFCGAPFFDWAVSEYALVAGVWF